MVSTMNPKEFEELEERFKNLKRKSMEIAIQIRKVADKEAKDELTRGKPKVYRMDDTGKDISGQEDNPAAHRMKLMNYSIREYEEWDKKQKAKEVKRGGANVQELAKYSYEKDLSKKKQDLKDRVTKVYRDPKSQRLQIKDDEKLVSQLASDLKRTTQERFLARKKEMEREDARATPGGYINKKNKQFNQKLDRQMEKLDR